MSPFPARLLLKRLFGVITVTEHISQMQMRYASYGFITMTGHRKTNMRCLNGDFGDISQGPLGVYLDISHSGITKLGRRNVRFNLMVAHQSPMSIGAKT